MPEMPITLPLRPRQSGRAAHAPWRSGPSFLLAALGVACAPAGFAQSAGPEPQQPILECAVTKEVRQPFSVTVYAGETRQHVTATVQLTGSDPALQACRIVVTSASRARYNTIFNFKHQGKCESTSLGKIQREGFIKLPFSILPTDPRANQGGVLLLVGHGTLNCEVRYWNESGFNQLIRNEFTYEE